MDVVPRQCLFSGLASAVGAQEAVPDEQAPVVQKRRRVALGGLVGTVDHDDAGSPDFGAVAGQPRYPSTDRNEGVAEILDHHVGRVVFHGDLDGQPLGWIRHPVQPQDQSMHLSLFSWRARRVADLMKVPTDLMRIE